MELGEILSDALTYPFQNIKALVIYIILGIILGIAVAGTFAGIFLSFEVDNVLTLIGSGIIGFIVAIFVGFVISGYQLDIIKYGINRDPSSPGIDFVRQFLNGVKYLVVYVVYMIIPIIISAILAIFFQHWFASVIDAILIIIFSLAAFMGECRLAKTEDLIYALAIGEAIGDISRVGILKLILFIIIIFIISFVIFFIASLIAQWNGIIGGILMGIFSVYVVFFVGRASGLLYSDV